MKLAKQIILLSAVGLCAIGLSLVLISGIVIGNEVSNSYKTDLREAKVNYDIQVNNINAYYEGGTDIKVDPNTKEITTSPVKGEIVEKKAEIENKATTSPNDVQDLEGYIDADTGAAVKGDIEKAKDDVKAAQAAVTAAGEGATDSDRAAVTAAQEKVSALEAKLTKLKADNAVEVKELEAQQKEELATAKKLYNSEKIALKTNKKNRIAGSFWYPDTTETQSLYEIGGVVVPVTTDNTTMKVTPMGTMMITGIALTLMGAALVVTIVIMNKVGCCQVEEKKAAPAKKAA